jgi:hypothetical protein
MNTLTVNKGVHLNVVHSVQLEYYFYVQNQHMDTPYRQEYNFYPSSIVLALNVSETGRTDRNFTNSC